MSLRLRLFGHLHATDDAVAAPTVLRPRAARLLAYLLLRRHTSLTRQSVAFTLWPDSREREALGTLRRALSDIRAALPAAGEWVIATHGVLRWNPDAPGWVDIVAFEHLIDQATPTALHDAVGLYSGDLLVEWDDEWVLIERERLRLLQFRALLQLIAHHRALGEYATALTLARCALALDSFAEAVYRDLIALHYQAGDRAAALAAYERLRALLYDEMGIEPMAETQALHLAILQGQALPAATATLGGLAAPPAARAPSPLIGRAAEMDWLSAGWGSAALGRGHLAILSGEAGIGKTHLALSLAAHAAKRGGLALVGHCYEFEHALPYQPIIEMLRSAANLLQRADLAPAYRAALARLAPDLLGMASSPATATEPLSEEVRAHLYETLLQVFLTLSRIQPLLLLFEDAHWAAESTLDWLTYIAPRLHAGRLLVMITYRTDEVGSQHALARLRRRFAHEGAVVALPLKPLSREATRELVAQISGLDAEMAIPIADRLHQETAGNPFFLHEIVRGLIEAGHVAVEEGRWSRHLVQAALETASRLPDSLRETITARVEHLPEMARRFIRAAAVAGRIFRYELVQRAGGWTDEQALEALEELLARGFVRESAGDGELAFAHHLVQEAVYAELAAPRRVYWHRRLVDTLVELASRLPAAMGQAMAAHIVHHALQGDLFALVFQWVPPAARHAYGLHAYADALSALELASSALEHLRGDPDFDLATAERQYIDVLLDRAALIPLVGRQLEEHRRVLHTAAELLARYPDRRLLAIYDLRQADYLSVLGQYGPAIEAALSAHARFLELRDQQGVAQSLREAGGYKLTISQNLAARQLLDQALTLYQSMGDQSGETNCLSGLAWVELNLGAVECALQHLNRGLELSEQRGDRLNMARTCYILAVAWDFYHNPARVQECAERSLRLYRETGSALTAYRPMLLLAEAHRTSGELAQAQMLCQEIFTIAGDNQDRWLEGWAAHILGRLALGREDLCGAEQRLCYAYQLRCESGELQNQISDLAWLSRLYLAQGQAATALEYSSRAIAQLESLWGEVYVWEMPDVFFAHAKALAANGDIAGSKANLQRAYDTLLEFASQIQEPSVRQVFLSYPINARIVAAWESERLLQAEART